MVAGSYSEASLLQVTVPSSMVMNSATTSASNTARVTDGDDSIAAATAQSVYSEIL